MVNGVLHKAYTQSNSEARNHQQAQPEAFQNQNTSQSINHNPHRTLHNFGTLSRGQSCNNDPRKYIQTRKDILQNFGQQPKKISRDLIKSKFNIMMQEKSLNCQPLFQKRDVNSTQTSSKLTTNILNGINSLPQKLSVQDTKAAYFSNMHRLLGSSGNSKITDRSTSMEDKSYNNNRNSQNKESFGKNKLRSRAMTRIGQSKHMNGYKTETGFRKSKPSSIVNQDNYLSEGRLDRQLDKIQNSLLKFNTQTNFSVQTINNPGSNSQNNLTIEKIQEVNLIDDINTRATYSQYGRSTNITNEIFDEKKQAQKQQSNQNSTKINANILRNTLMPTVASNELDIKDSKFDNIRLRLFMSNSKQKKLLRQQKSKTNSGSKNGTKHSDKEKKTSSKQANDNDTHKKDENTSVVVLGGITNLNIGSKEVLINSVSEEKTQFSVSMSKVIGITDKSICEVDNNHNKKTGKENASVSPNIYNKSGASLSNTKMYENGNKAKEIIEDMIDNSNFDNHQLLDIKSQIQEKMGMMNMNNSLNKSNSQKYYNGHNKKSANNSKKDRAEPKGNVKDFLQVLFKKKQDYCAKRNIKGKSVVNRDRNIQENCSEGRNSKENGVGLGGAKYNEICVEIENDLNKIVDKAHNVLSDIQHFKGYIPNIGNTDNNDTQVKQYKTPKKDPNDGKYYNMVSTKSPIFSLKNLQEKYNNSNQKKQPRSKSEYKSKNYKYNNNKPKEEPDKDYFEAQRFKAKLEYHHKKQMIMSKFRSDKTNRIKNQTPSNIANSDTQHQKNELLNQDHQILTKNQELWPESKDTSSDWLETDQDINQEIKSKKSVPSHANNYLDEPDHRKHILLKQSRNSEEYRYVPFSNNKENLQEFLSYSTSNDIPNPYQKKYTSTDKNLLVSKSSEDSLRNQVIRKVKAEMEIYQKEMSEIFFQKKKLPKKINDSTKQFEENIDKYFVNSNPYKTKYKFYDSKPDFECGSGKEEELVIKLKHDQFAYNNGFELPGADFECYNERVNNEDYSGGSVGYRQEEQVGFNGPTSTEYELEDICDTSQSVILIQQQIEKLTVNGFRNFSGV